MQRFEIKWFDGFDVHRVLEVVRRQPGVQRPRMANQFGWSNQPQVVRFSGNDETRGHVQHALIAAGLTDFPIIHEVKG